jgi:hypothetical protein
MIFGVIKMDEASRENNDQGQGRGFFHFFDYRTARARRQMGPARLYSPPDFC